MSSLPGRLRNFKTPPWVLPAFGYAISLASLVWVYWGFDWKPELLRFIRSDWRWVTVALIADVAVYFIQAWRWRVLLSPVKRVSYLRSVQAVYVGLFANEVLPLRSGELIRSYVLGRWTEIPFSVTLSSAVLERLFDGIWLAVGFLVISPFLDLPGYLINVAYILCGLLLAVAAMLGVVMFGKHHAHAAVSSSRWSATLWHVVEGLHRMGNSPSFYISAIASLFYLGMQIAPIYALARGYELDLPLGAAAVVLVVLRLGTVLPQAPGNVGGFQFFTVVGLGLFGIDKALATGFATAAFMIVTVPLWLGGLIAVAVTGLKIRDLQAHAQSNLRNTAKDVAGAGSGR